MSHCLFEERLGPWLDGELTEAASREVAAHAADCAVCRCRVEESQRLSAAIRQMERHPMPDDLKEKLLTVAATRSGTLADKSGFRAGSWLIGTAAAAAVIVVAVMGLRPDAETPLPIRMNPKQDSPVEIDQIAQERSEDSMKDSTASRQEPVSKPTTSPRKAIGPPPAPAPARDRNREAEKRMAATGEKTTDELTSVASPAATLPSVAEPPPEPQALSVVAAKPAHSPPVSRFETQLIQKENEKPMLGPIVAQVAVAEPGPAESRLTRERPADRSAGVASSTISLAKEETSPTKLTFIVHIDKDGRVLAVDPVGAVLVSPERARVARDLLAAATVPTHGLDQPMLVVVEVLVTENP